MTVFLMTYYEIETNVFILFIILSYFQIIGVLQGPNLTLNIASVIVNVNEAYINNVTSANYLKEESSDFSNHSTLTLK